jgi:predicted GTPase
MGPADSSSHLPSPAEKAQIEQIFNSVWEAAARVNPMLLAKLSRDYALKRLHDMIRDCLAKGLTVAETREHTVKELLRSASMNTQPRSTCYDSDPGNQVKSTP